MSSTDVVALDLLVRDVMRRRLAEAAQDRLAAQLTRAALVGAARPSLQTTVRQTVASGLRAAALRIDPSLGAAQA